MKPVSCKQEMDDTECLVSRSTTGASGGFPDSSAGKESTCNAETMVRFLGRGDPLEKGMATHSSILAWRIPWTVPWCHKDSGMTE